MSQLEKSGELKRVGIEVDTHLEMTEICDRVLRAEGPAILFEKPRSGQTRHTIPVLANLFGTPKRVALGMGEEAVQAPVSYTHLDVYKRQALNTFRRKAPRWSSATMSVSSIRSS